MTSVDGLQGRSLSTSQKRHVAGIFLVTILMDFSHVVMTGNAKTNVCWRRKPISVGSEKTKVQDESSLQYF